MGVLGNEAHQPNLHRQPAVSDSHQEPRVEGEMIMARSSTIPRCLKPLLQLSSQKWVKEC